MAATEPTRVGAAVLVFVSCVAWASAGAAQTPELEEMAPTEGPRAADDASGGEVSGDAPAAGEEAPSTLTTAEAVVGVTGVVVGAALAVSGAIGIVGHHACLQREAGRCVRYDASDDVALVGGWVAVGVGPVLALLGGLTLLEVIDLEEPRESAGGRSTATGLRPGVALRGDCAMLTLGGRL